MMMYPDIKVALVELTLLAMKIQDDSACLAHININHSIGVWSVYISDEYVRRMSDSENMYEAHIMYGDDYHNEHFEESYRNIKSNLENIYHSIKSEASI